MSYVKSFALVSGFFCLFLSSLIYVKDELFLVMPDADTAYGHLESQKASAREDGQAYVGRHSFLRRTISGLLPKLIVYPTKQQIKDDENRFSEVNQFSNEAAQQEFKEFQERSQYLVDELACRYPIMDPWHPSLRGLIQHPRSVQCRQIQRDFSFIDDYGFLHLNRTTLQNYNYWITDRNSSTENIPRLGFACFYQSFDRIEVGSDMIGDYDLPRDLQLDKAVALQRDFVLVNCLFQNRTIYTNLHAHPSNNSLKLRQPKQPSSSQLSVLLFVLDSLSLPLMRRSLSETYEYLTKRQDFVVFEGFHKVGDNTFPNMVSLLSGQRMRNEQADMPNEAQMSFIKDYFDNRNVPLIWQNFSDAGYETTFLEDWPKFGLFQYGKKGFRVKPTDHFYFTFWKAALNLSSSNAHPLLMQSSKFCLGNKPTVDIHLDIVRRHLIKGFREQKLQFTYAFYTDLSHDGNNDIERGDHSFRDFFHDAFESPDRPLLNNTVVIFMGDHGSRFGNFRDTAAGWFEERRPAFLIKFPDWFYRLYPHIRRNLEDNRFKLSSHFDVHETLSDILAANYDGMQRPLTARGLSQLYAIPGSRTCHEAGIPLYYCTCLATEKLDFAASQQDRKLAQSAAGALMAELSGLLGGHLDKCAKLQLLEIEDAERVLSESYLKAKQAVDNKNFDEANSFDEEFFVKIVITTKPGRAKFEAFVKFEVPSAVNSRSGSNRNLEDASVTVFSGISRLNMYGSQSSCVGVWELKKYCYCIV